MRNLGLSALPVLCRPAQLCVELLLQHSLSLSVSCCLSHFSLVDGTLGTEVSTNNPGYRVYTTGAWDSNAAGSHYFWIYGGEVSGEYYYPADLW